MWPRLNRETLRRFFRPTLDERKRILRWEAWGFVIACYGLFLFAFLLPGNYRSTSRLYLFVSWMAFLTRTFLFHAGLVVIVITAVAAIVRRWRLLAAAAPLLAITFGPSLWMMRSKSPPAAQGRALTVMTANLLVVNRNTGPVIAEIREAAPDILFLQEYASHWHDALMDELGTDYPYVCGIQREDSFGAAVYSKIPFVGKPTRYLSMGTSGVPQIRAVVDVEETHVAVYNIHLLPPRRFDYVQEQRLQFADLLDHLQAEQLPLIMCGDFNFTFMSGFAASLRKLGLADAHAGAGHGQGRTWPGTLFLRWMPGLRLDQIWTSSDLTCTECRTGVGTGSDHRPVVARISTP